MASLALITVYHFNSSDSEPYARLVRSLRSSISQLGPTDRLILVANGVRDSAADPDLVIKDVNPTDQDRIVPVIMLKNGGAAGGLNVGISAALREECHWLGPVQSGVVVSPTWVEQMRSCACDGVHSLGGRLTYEDQPNVVWSDGHYLKEGRTWDVGQKSRVHAPPQIPGRWMFPCLSACLFSRDSAEKVRSEYGNFVTEQLSHYGDCPDVALRCAHVAHANFSFNTNALGTKRRPVLERGNIASSQLIAAQRYYDGRTACGRKRLETNERDRRFVDDAERRAQQFGAAPYSPLTTTAPRARADHDREWGHP